jgi:hypothetical protein
MAISGNILKALLYKHFRFYSGRSDRRGICWAANQQERIILPSQWSINCGLQMIQPLLSEGLSYNYLPQTVNRQPFWQDSDI